MTETPKRPHPTDPAVIEAVIDGLIPSLQEWLAGHGDSASEECLRTDLRNVLKWGETDGFALAKNMDREGWFPDAELVEILDGVACIQSDVVRNMTITWVKFTGAKPEFAKGDIVKTPYGTGPIYDIYHDTAQYLVQTPDFLSRRGPDAKGGTVVAFEQARLVEEEAA